MANQKKHSQCGLLVEIYWYKVRVKSNVKLEC